MIYFLDTSALLKRYVEEEGSEYIRQLLTRPDLSFHQSFLTPLEMTSALYRRHRGGLLSNQELVDSNAYTAHTQDRYATILHSNSLMTLAASLIARHPLRTLDVSNSPQRSLCKALFRQTPHPLLLCLPTIA